MQFKAENRAFADALDLVKGAIRPSTVPILSHVCVTASDGVVTLRANNLDRETEASFRAEVTREGSAALPGEILAGIVRRLPKGGDCTLDLRDEVAELTSRKSVYKLRSLPADDFPKGRRITGEAAVFEMDGATFRDLLRHVAYPANETHPKQYSRGVYLHAHEGKLAATATDGHRLALVEVDLPEGAAEFPEMIIPASTVKAILELTAKVDRVVVAGTRHAIEVRVEGARLTSALVDCAYPDYRKVIPKRNGAAAVFRPDSMSEALDRAATVYLGRSDPNKLAPTVKITAGDDSIELVAGIAGGERGLETVEADINEHPLEVSVVTTYLAEMLKQWPETTDLAIQHGGGMGPVLFCAAAMPNVTHLIMPTKPTL